MKRTVTILMLVLSAIALPAAAQLRLAPTHTGETGLVTTVSGLTMRQGDVSFGIYYNNWDRLAAHLPLQPHGVGTLDYDFNRVSASVGFGLTDNWEASVMVPYDFYKADENHRAGVINGRAFFDDVDESGLGDVRLATKFRLAGEPEGDFGVALHFFADAPTGDDDAGLAPGDASFGGGFAFTSGSFNTNLAYRVVGDANHYDTPDEILANLGFAWPLGDRFHFILEGNGTFYQSGDSQPEDLIEMLIAGRAFFGDGGWGMTFGLRTELNNIDLWDEGFCPIGGVLGFHYAPYHLPAPPPPPPAPPVEIAPTPTPAPTPIVAPPPAPEVVKIEEVRFESNSARLTNIAKAILDEVALRMKERPEAVAEVTGYTDDREKDPQGLGQRRADAVKDYLVKRHGIDSSRITTMSKGSSEPIGDNATEAGRAKNRRSVIKLTVK